MVIANVIGNMDLLISVINALQFVFHLPIMNINFQANVMTYNKIMIPIVMFDYIESVPWINDRF